MAGADRKINIYDLIGPIGAATPAQRAELLAVLAFEIAVASVNGKTGEVVLTASDIEGILSDTAFDTERTLTHMFGKDAVGWGFKSLTNFITRGMMAVMAPNTVIGRITGSTGTPEVLNAANIRTIIDLASGGKADFGAALTALAADSTLNKAAGLAIATMLNAAMNDTSGVQAATRVQINAARLLWSSINLTDGYHVLGVENASTRVGGIVGLNADGTVADILAGTADTVTDTETNAAAFTPTPHNSVSNLLTIDFDDEEGFYRTHTTTQNTVLALSNLHPHTPALIQILGGGAHNLNWPSGTIVTPSSLKETGLTVAAGEYYDIIVRYTGSAYKIAISDVGEAAS